MCESLEVQCMLNRHFNPLTKNYTSLKNHWIPSDVALFNQSSPDWIILRGIKQLSVDISSVLYYCFLKEQQYSFYGGQQRPSSLKKGPSPWEKQWFTHTAGIPLGTLMRDKHHLVLDNCTTYTHKNESKLWLQQTTRSLSLWRLNYTSRRICHYTYQTSTLLCLQ